MKTQISALLTSAAVVTGAITLASAPAQAVSFSCSTTDITFPTGINATSCSGPLSGNDTGANSTLESDLEAGLFSSTGLAEWTLEGKSDGNEGTLGITAGNGSTSGSFTLGGSLSDYTGKTFAISLKASNKHSVYLFEDFQGTSLTGSFNTIGTSQNGRGRAQSLSHASLWMSDIQSTTPNPPSTRVPEPASLIGLGLVASGMVVARRRRVAG